MDKGQASLTEKVTKEFFTELLQFAKEQDVTICLENLPMAKFSLADPRQVLKFVKDYPQFETNDVSYSMVEGFLTYGESTGIDVNVFYDVWKYNSSAKADVDKNGKAISGSKKEKVLDYIDKLPLSKAQKDSLYYALGWAESTIREAPWR